MTTPIEVHGLIFAQPKTGLLAMWGPAAWAQSQLTPGVSALAAPPPDLWLGKWRAPESQPMSLGFIWQCPAAWRFRYGGQPLQADSDWN
jgi:hypothetical protein